MVQIPDAEKKRVGYLTEIVHLAAKYLINKSKQAHQDEVFGCVAYIILDCNSDPVFQPYKNDKTLLKNDMVKSVRMLEDQKIVARNPDSSGYLVPGSGTSINSLVTYSSLYSLPVNLGDIGAGIKL